LTNAGAGGKDQLSNPETTQVREKGTHYWNKGEEDGVIAKRDHRGRGDGLIPQGTNNAEKTGGRGRGGGWRWGGMGRGGRMGEDEAYGRGRGAKGYGKEGRKLRGR